MEAIESFPERADRVETQKGKAILVKTDIFKGLLFYAYEHDHGRGKLYPQTIDMVKEIQQSAVRGNLLPDFREIEGILKPDEFEGGGRDYSDVTGAVELPEEIRRKKKKSSRFQDRRPSDDRPQLTTNRPPHGNRPEGGRPHENNRSDQRPVQGNRPQQTNRPNPAERPNMGERPTGNRQNEGPRPEQRSPAENRPQGNRPQGNRPPQGNRSQGNRPPFRQGGGTRPENKPNENRREDNSPKGEA
jgi:hypothetical protein